MGTSDVFPEYLLGHPKHDRRNPHNVPEDKAPKSRPPDSARDKIPFYGRLPKYSGPYEVGIIDLEIPVREPRHISAIRRQHRHILVLETVLLTIYYPACLDCANNERILQAKHHHNARPTWLPRPRLQTAKGYGKLASLPAWPSMAWFAMTTMLTKLPAYRNARLADHWPEVEKSWHDRDGSSTAGPIPEEGPTKPKFPLILFSHGIGGTKTCYSTICGEFASHGFIVCALEHRDGSGPRTVVNVPNSARRVTSEALAKTEHHLKPSHKHPWDSVDFIVPESDKYDTVPSHEIDHALRQSQIELRTAEIDEAFYVMQELCAGRGAELRERNVRKRGTPGASSLGLEGVEWETFKDRFHTDNVTLVGHSFGSATTVNMLRSNVKYNYITQAIIYDIWGSPVPEATEENHIQVPVLGINSEAFMYWDDNFKVAKQVVEEAAACDQPAWLLTVRGTVHISQSDFCILYPRIASLVLKATMNPVRAIDVNIDASLDFLDRTLHTGDVQPFRRNLPLKKYLDIKSVRKMPTEHKPKARWTAMRIRIEHEGRKRIIPNHKQKYWKRLKELGEEEVWLHFAPGRKEAVGGPADDDESDDDDWQNVDKDNSDANKDPEDVATET